MGCGRSKCEQMISEIKYMVESDLLKDKSSEDKQAFNKIFDPLIEKMFPTEIEELINDLDEDGYNTMLNDMKAQLKNTFNDMVIK